MDLYIYKIKILNVLTTKGIDILFPIGGLASLSYMASMASWLHLRKIIRELSGEDMGRFFKSIMYE